jgi:hypothetical protein
MTLTVVNRLRTHPDPPPDSFSRQMTTHSEAIPVQSGCGKWPLIDYVTIDLRLILSHGQPFRNPINEGLATSLTILAIVHVAFLLSLGYNVGTFLH